VIAIPGAVAVGVYNANLTVRNASGCVSTLSAVTVTVGNPTITLGANPSVCSGTTTANLTYSGTTGSPDQYSIDFDATANTAGFVDLVNAPLPSSPIVITVPGVAAAGVYNANLTVRNSVGGCAGTLAAISINVLSPADPLCTGGGTGTCATVVITPVPSPATCTLSNGSINFNINPATPIVNPSGVKITITGISTTNSTIARTNFNDPAFPALPIGVYNYSIEYGDVSCLKTGQVTIDQSGTVGAPVASNILAPVCAASSTGSLTLDVPGETGNILQWSLDGIAFTNFTAGSTITGVPAGLAPTFQRVISVRRNATDPCNASVTIVIQDASPAITTTLTPTDATCANNDGSILVDTVSGGVGPYTYQLNGTTISLPASNTITGRSGGSYTLTIADSNNCQVDFTTTVNFPGLVNYTSTVNNPDCTGSGQNGSIVLTITSTGTFLAGITTDPIAPPTAFQNVVSAGSTPVTFGGLSKGTYYVSLTPTGAACPTKAPFVISSGPDQVDFSLSAQNILCFENKGGVAISAIEGSPLVNFSYEIVDATGAIVPASSVTPANPINQLQALGTVNLLGLTAGDYKIRLFQDQSVASGCVAPISSAFKSFTVLGPTAALDTLYVTRTISLPDQPTGTILVGLKESQQTPYQVRLELKKPIDPLQAFLLDYTDFPPRNTQNLKIEYNIRNLFAGLYELKIKDALGCEKTYADIEIKVDVNIFIPNVFTPNEDGSNETFFIRNLPADSKVNISNRWGAEVYSSSNYQNDWNGSNNADGVYFYRVVAGGNTFTGWVEIIRGK
jgi:gliding motility-associated-like protein